MKLSHAIISIGLSLPCGCQAFVPNRLSHSGVPPTLQVLTVSSTTNSDAAFSAFADSLEEEIEVPSRQRVTTKEKSWQAKLEDLLDPKTNLAERQILLSELLNSNEQIQQSVMEALANRKVGTTVLIFTVWSLKWNIAAPLLVLFFDRLAFIQLILHAFVSLL